VKNIASNPGKAVELDVGNGSKEEKLKMMERLRWSVRSFIQENDIYKSVKLIKKDYWRHYWSVCCRKGGARKEDTWRQQKS